MPSPVKKQFSTQNNAMRTSTKVISAASFKPVPKQFKLKDTHKEITLAPQKIRQNSVNKKVTAYASQPKKKNEKLSYKDLV